MSNIKKVIENGKEYYVLYSLRHTSYYKDKECTIRHREDGPAVEWKNGESWWWYKNGVPHREGGPAVEYAAGYKEYWLNGKEYKEEEYWSKIKFGEFV